MADIVDVVLLARVCGYSHKPSFDYFSSCSYLPLQITLMVQNGILLNWLGDSNSVANLVTGLWKNITQVNFSSEYFTLCNELNKFYRDPWHHKKATLRRDYCNTPWQTAASLAEIVLLILSLIQSVCSVIQVLDSK